MKELSYEQVLVTRYNSGESLTSLAKSERMRKETIKRYLLELGVELRLNKGGKRTAISTELKELIIKDWKDGNDINLTTLGKKYSISNKGVEKVLREANLYDTKFPDTTDEQKQLMNQLYKSGLSSRAVAEKMNLSKTTVLEYLDEAREPSSFRIYSVNEDYFENIDNQEKAYWLGLLYADGYNSEERGYVRFGQAKKDKELVYKFKNILEAEHPVVFNERHGKVQDFYQISVSSVKLSKDLARHGCMQNKTFKTEFPNIPEELYSHFIRGYFDGDGSIWNSSGYPNISITGNIGLLERIQEILMKECQLNKTKLISRRKNSIVDIRYGGRNQIRRIYDYLYKDATTFLSRKHNILNNILNKSLDDNR